MDRLSPSCAAPRVVAERKCAYVKIEKHRSNRLVVRRIR
jgi:hypothetical protein